MNNLKNDNKRILEMSEKEYQHYCAYKLIESEIKGCLDRERKLEAELKEKDFAYNDYYEKAEESIKYLTKKYQEKDQEIERIHKICLEEINSQAGIIAKQHEKIRELKYHLQVNNKQFCEKIREELNKLDFENFEDIVVTGWWFENVLFPKLQNLDKTEQGK